MDGPRGRLHHRKPEPSGPMNPLPAEKLMNGTADWRPCIVVDILVTQPAGDGRDVHA